MLRTVLYGSSVIPGAERLAPFFKIGFGVTGIKLFPDRVLRWDLLGHIIAHPSGSIAHPYPRRPALLVPFGNSGPCVGIHIALRPRPWPGIHRPFGLDRFPGRRNLRTGTRPFCFRPGCSIRRCRHAARFRGHPAVRFPANDRRLFFCFPGGCFFLRFRSRRNGRILRSFRHIVFFRHVIHFRQISRRLFRHDRFFRLFRHSRCLRLRGRFRFVLYNRPAEYIGVIPDFRFLRRFSRAFYVRRLVRFPPVPALRVHICI